MPVELFHFMCGERIGQGIAREVYVFKPDPSKVIKFDLGTSPYDFQNLMEWLLWEAAPPHVRKWLAPCYDISANGRILLQARTSHYAGEQPKGIPRVMDDMHLDNWGLYHGKPVAMDYGRNHILERAFRR
jgi:hypothetical protein